MFWFHFLNFVLINSINEVAANQSSNTHDHLVCKATNRKVQHSSLHCWIRWDIGVLRDAANKWQRKPQIAAFTNNWKLIRSMSGWFSILVSSLEKQWNIIISDCNNINCSCRLVTQEKIKACYFGFLIYRVTKSKLIQ